MMKYTNVVIDSSGNALAGVTITVYLAGTLTLATLYSDNAFTSQANPITGAADGSFSFYAQNGRYDIKLTKTGFTFGTSNYDTLLVDPYSVITPTQIAANTNNYNPTNGLNCTTWRISADADARQITGIVAGNSGQFLRLFNIGTKYILLMNENTNSLAANRISLGTTWASASTPEGYKIPPGGFIELMYDTTSVRWLVIAGRNWEYTVGT